MNKPTPEKLLVPVETARKIILIGSEKYGSTRQLALKLGISMCHMYRWKNREARMYKTWYQKIDRLIKKS